MFHYYAIFGRMQINESIFFACKSTNESWAIAIVAVVTAF